MCKALWKRTHLSWTQFTVKDLKQSNSHETRTSRRDYQCLRGSDSGIEGGNPKMDIYQFPRVKEPSSRWRHITGDSNFFYHLLHECVYLSGTARKYVTYSN